MPSVTTHAVVLRFANYREHDRMLSLLSPELGRVEVLARGCRKPKSPLVAACEWFVHGEFVLFQNRDRYVLTSCTLEDSFYPLRQEPYRLNCAAYMAALCHAAAQQGEQAGDLYALLLKGLYYLAYDESATPLDLTTAFVLLFADVLGYRPRLSRCAHCHQKLDVERGGKLDLEAGGLCCPNCASRGTITLSVDDLKWMSHTLRNGLCEHENSGAGTLFDVLRRYVEMRLDMPIKASRLLP